MSDQKNVPAPDSWSGKHLLGARDVESVNRLGTDEASVSLHNVVRDPATGAAARGDRRPLDGEVVAGQPSEPSVDRAGNDPFDVVEGGVIGARDHDGSRIFNVEGVDPVDGVGPGEARTVVVRGEDVGQGAGVQHQPEGSDSDNPHEEFPDGHGNHSRDAQSARNSDLMPNSGEFVTPRWLKVLAGCLITIIAAAIAFAVFEPIQVLPRLRLAPGYALKDQAGESFTSETVRGSVTLYSFTSLDCDVECLAYDDTMNNVKEDVAESINLGDTKFQLVTVVLDADPTPAELRAVASRSGADGAEWAVVGGDANDIANTVSSGFGRFYETNDDSSIRFDPGYILVDGAGVIRGDYRYQTLSDDADKIVRHLDILATELKYANGSAAFAYEAAHLFLCYP